MPDNFQINISQPNGPLIMDFAVVVQKPQIPGDVRQLVIATGNPGTRNINLAKRYYAACGYGSGMQPGMMVAISQERSVSLGQSNRQGSTIGITGRGGQPSMEQKGDSAPANSFSIDVDGSVNRGSTFVGYGGSVNNRQAIYAIWPADPNARYQVQPSNTYFLVPGRFQVGEIIDERRVREGLELNLDAVANKDTGVAEVVVQPDRRFAIRG